MMPNCAECGAAMSTVMRRRNEVVETSYECPSCKKERDTKREDQPDSEEAGSNA